MKLKIKIVAFEKAVVMQVLEQEGFPERIEEGRIQISCCPNLFSDTICLRRDKAFDKCISTYNTTEPKTYIKKVISWIDEFFGVGEMKFPCLCWVWNDDKLSYVKRFVLGKNYLHVGNPFLAISGESGMPDNIIRAIVNNGTTPYKHAEPIEGHKQEGDIYTWEIE